ncbi:MAG TPA: ATP-binding protein [Defluviitaleaceae bacterium]|nr:ATP-binding protein [Defluviitaleaceae bacterium]
MNKSPKTIIDEDIIELGLPINPAYVSTARLTALSIANRMGFNIEDIEDIKAAVSEACTYLIKMHQLDKSIQNMFNIQFIIKSNALDIMLTAEKIKFDNIYEEDGLGILMIEALMDYISLSSKDDANINIFMSKKLK